MRESRYSVFIKDVPQFKKYRDEIRLLYYKKHGNTLSMGDVIMLSMSLAKTVLNNEEYLVAGRQNDYSVDKRYGRVG